LKIERITRAVAILTIMNAIITIISSGFSFLMHMYLSYKLHIDASKASSIGIIGGADGPTAIYVTDQSSPHLITVIFALLSIAGIAYLIFIKRLKKRD